MSPTQPATTVVLAVLDPHGTDHGTEVHKAGGNDLNQPYRGGPKGERSWTVMASSLTAPPRTWPATSSPKGSTTVDQAIDEHIHWAPCVRLPRGRAATARQRSEGDR
jgi:hypothetical protein